ncbi:22401_t:CDS:2 [Gigaspora rosea]|nr:22401_t:CDS:2 [Gigaspora rosea]
MRIWVEQIVNNSLFLTEIRQFKKHNSLYNIRLYEESGSVQTDNLFEYQCNLHDIIQNYALDNVFNSNEMGLLFHMSPD